MVSLTESDESEPNGNRHITEEGGALPAAGNNARMAEPGGRTHTANVRAVAGCYEAAGERSVNHNGGGHGVVTGVQARRHITWVHGRNVVRYVVCRLRRR